MPFGNATLSPVRHTLRNMSNSQKPERVKEYKPRKTSKPNDEPIDRKIKKRLTNYMESQ